MIINTEEKLREFFPNFMTAPDGEASLLEKLTTSLLEAQSKLASEITSFQVMDDVEKQKRYDNLYLYCCRYIVSEALRRELPLLDVVLTGNGLATVGTSNVAVASDHRIERLLSSLLEERDEMAFEILKLLPAMAKWRSSEQCRFFCRTLFSSPAFLSPLFAGNPAKWDAYLVLLPKISEMEHDAALNWISPELMSALRRETVEGFKSPVRKHIAEELRSAIISLLSDKASPKRRFVDMVNFIRCNPEEFGEWHQSRTAMLFSPVSFRNEKKSGGYFF